MRTRRARVVAFLSVGLGLVVVAALVIVSWDLILERWYIHRLSADKGPIRLQAIEELEKRESVRAVPYIAEVAVSQPDSRTRALEALHALAPRADVDVQAGVIEALVTLAREELESGRIPATGFPTGRFQTLQTSQSSADALPGCIEHLGARLEGGFPILGAVLRGGSTSRLFAPCARALAGGWPGSRDALDGFFRSCGPGLLREFLDALTLPEQPNPRVVVPSTGQVTGRTAIWQVTGGIQFRVQGSSFISGLLPLHEPAREVAAHAASVHPDPEGRALALSYAVVKRESAEDPAAQQAPQAWDPDWEVVRRALGDPAPRVRRAALRLTGFLGRLPGSPDLGRLFLQAEISPQLVDIIEARDLWSHHPLTGHTGLKIGIGEPTPWETPGAVAGSRPPAPAVPWSDGEVARLEEILQSATDPNLRDAASRALAGRNVGPASGEPAVCEALEVHEWGVWRESRGILRPSEELTADLPAFVHGSEWSTEKLIEARSPRLQTPQILIVNKPVVFFHVREPLSVLVRVGFFAGRPWTFYPAATDYLLAARPLSDSSAPPSLVAVDRRGFAFEDRTGTGPPWALGEAPGTTFRTVPWVLPRSPTAPVGSGQGGRMLGLGLEWRGLRVGYREALEQGLQSVGDDGAWWRHLRAASGSLVSLGDESERFLFYDGAVDLPGPVVASWADAGKRALLLRARKLGDFPARGEFFSGEGDAADGSVPAPSDPPAPRGALRGSLVIEKVTGQPARGAFIRGLLPDASPGRVPLESLALEARDIPQVLEAELVAEGLTAPEARSLVGTWQRELFEEPGVRVVSFVPRWLYDRALPLRIFPRPARLVRVGLVIREGHDLAVEEPEATVEQVPVQTFPIQGTAYGVTLEDSELELGPTEALEKGTVGQAMAREILSGLDVAEAVLSRDGSRALVRGGRAGEDRLYMLDLESLTAVSVAPSAGEPYHRSGALALSRTGEKAAFVLPYRGPAWRVCLADFSARSLLTVFRTSVGPIRFSLSAEGDVLVLPHRQSLRIFQGFEDGVAEGASSTREIKVRSEGFFARACVSPDGKRVAFSVQDGRQNRGELGILDLEADYLLSLRRDPAPDGRLVLNRDGTLLGICGHRGQSPVLLRTPPRPQDLLFTARDIVESIRFSEEDGFLWDLSEDGGKLLRGRDDTLEFYDRSTQRRIPIPGSQGARCASMSGDGSRVLFLAPAGDAMRLRIVDVKP